ncbi:hypothetical protein DFQ13_12220 [Actinokineospora spheciospongiae]|nr:hypothetical protein DFQ13_12220 [Actinokineospora spheciospongiae]
MAAAGPHGAHRWPSTSRCDRSAPGRTWRHCGNTALNARRALRVWPAARDSSVHRRARQRGCARNAGPQLSPPGAAARVRPQRGTAAFAARRGRAGAPATRDRSFRRQARPRGCTRNTGPQLSPPGAAARVHPQHGTAAFAARRGRAGAPATRDRSFRRQARPRGCTRNTGPQRSPPGAAVRPGGGQRWAARLRWCGRDWVGRPGRGAQQRLRAAITTTTPVTVLAPARHSDSSLPATTDNPRPPTECLWTTQVGPASACHHPACHHPGRLGQKPLRDPRIPRTPDRVRPTRVRAGPSCTARAAPGPPCSTRVRGRRSGRPGPRGRCRGPGGPLRPCGPRSPRSR